MRRDERREHDRCLSDHVVRLTEQRRRNFKIKNTCRLEIDNEFKLGRLFDREVSGLVALRIGVRGLRNSQRQYWNSFKHATMPYQKGKQTAERDDDKLLKAFRDEKNDLALLIGWYDYHLATRKMPIEAQTQQAWYSHCIQKN
jgi:hypothetical protein